MSISTDNTGGDHILNIGETEFLGLDGFREEELRNSEESSQNIVSADGRLPLTSNNNTVPAGEISAGIPNAIVTKKVEILEPDNDYGIDRRLPPISTKSNFPARPAAGLTQDRINTLLSGYTWTLPANRVLTYSFYEDSVFNGSYYGSETGVREVSEAVKTSVRRILDWMESVLNIDFQEVTETATTYGTLRYMLSDGPGYAYCYYPTTHPLGGDTHLNPDFQHTFDLNGFEQPAGNHGYMTLIHETGHGLGLKHPHEAPALVNIDDNTSNTVMSYRFTGESAGTLMAYDVAALQQLYGSRAKEAGNTTYLFSSRIDQFTVGGVSPLTTPNNTKQLIWDTGGTDTLDFSALATEAGGYRLDMNEGGWLSTNAAYRFQATIDDYNVTGGPITSTYFVWGTSLGYGVTIENLVNSSSADTIFANSAANRFTGYTAGRAVGADVLWNTTSADILELAGYTFASVTRTQSGNDLILGLGANGSVTVKNYYVSSQLSIVYAGSTLPAISLAVSPATVAENGTTNLVYTFTRSGAPTTAALTVNFTLGGTATLATDYVQTGGSVSGTNGTVTFAAGASTATVVVDPTDDTAAEPDETVSLTLASSSNYTVSTTAAVTGTITNDDTLPRVTLSVSPRSVLENGTTNLVYTFTRSGAPTTNALAVNYNIATTGTNVATRGTDYTTSQSLTGTGPYTVNFAPGASTATVVVDPTPDSIVEPNETVSLSLVTNPNYVVGTTTAVTGTITNDDTLPRVSLAVNPATSTVQEDGTTNIVYTFTRSGNLSAPLTVNYRIAGTATNGVDYATLGTSVVFAPFSNTATLTVDPLADSVVELNNETLSLTLLSGSTYLVGTPSAATSTITDGNDLLIGNELGNNIRGGPGNDSLFGLEGNDTLSGGTGNDSLMGGAGNDSLLGEAGMDRFIFTSSSEGVDRIVNFSPVDDTVELYSTDFPNIGAAGTLVASAFASGPGLVAAPSATVRLIYNTSTGSLLFDSDGNGPGVSRQLALFTTSPVTTPPILTSDDFFVV